MRLSKAKAKIRKKSRQQAVRLYKKGHTTREIGKIMNKSHQWAWLSVKDI